MPGPPGQGRSPRLHSWLIRGVQLIKDRRQLGRLDRLLGRRKFFAGKPAMAEQRSGLAFGQALAAWKISGCHAAEKEDFGTLEMVAIPAKIAVDNHSWLLDDVRRQPGLLVQLPARGGDMRLPWLKSAARGFPEDGAITRVPPAKQQHPALRVHAQHARRRPMLRWVLAHQSSMWAPARRARHLVGAFGLEWSCDSGDFARVSKRPAVLASWQPCASQVLLDDGT